MRIKPSRSQAGKTEIKKDGGEMLVAIALDKPLAAVKALVEDPTKLIAEIMQILQDKHAHPVLAQMVHPICVMIYTSPNLLLPPQPAAAAAREN